MRWYYSIFLMKLIRAFVFVSVFVINRPALSQQLFTSTGVKNAYAKNTRTIEGKPGKNYWQNRGNYSIRVSFDPVTNLLQGAETINYFNNSPDTLKEIIIRLYPDLYKKEINRLSNIDEKDLNNGVEIDSFKIEDENAQGVGIDIHGRSAYVEVQHVFFHKKTYGLWVKQEGSCVDSLQYPNFIISNIYIHDNKIVKK